jgi:hypothetical protein
MDPVLVAYYGGVCALLGAVSPVVPGLLLRLGIGAAVGIGAVAGLPALRLALGV